MLPASSQKIAQSLGRSLIAATRSLATATAPLTDPLEDDAVVAARRNVHHEVKVSSLANGVKVASCDAGGGVSRVSIAVQAGSRFESANILGITHAMKNAAFISNQGRSSLRTVRETQQVGGSLEASNSRELLTRKATFLRHQLGEVMENVAPGLTSPLFNAWELAHVKELCQGDLAALSATAVNLELLHKAAFRNGLGNSIYCDALKLGNVSADQLEAFCSEFYVGSGVTVVGTDVDHDELMRYSKELLGGLEAGTPAAVPAQRYHGGEVHVNTCNGLTHASLFGTGAGLSSADLPAFAVLQKLLGSGPSIKWGSNTVSSRLNKAAALATDQPFTISSLNISYSDAGLFGVHAASTPQAIQAVLSSAVKEIQALSNGVSAEDLQQAKCQAKTSVLMLNESNEDHLDDLVKQVILTGAYASPAETLSALEDVTADKVVEISKQVLSKPTLTISGDTSYAPYLDELL